MKHKLLIIFFALSIGLGHETYAQAKERIRESAKQSAINKTERTVDSAIEEAADGMINGVKSIFKKKKNKKESEAFEQNDDDFSRGLMEEDKAQKDDAESMNQPSIEQKSFARYAKFSFVQGEDIIAFDDFRQDNIGDLPASWITTGTAEIVSFEEIEGNWVWFNKTKGNFIPEYLRDFPENFTLEFDLMYDFAFGTYSFSRVFNLVFTDIPNPESNMGWNGSGEYFSLQKLSNNYVGIEFSGIGSNGGPFITAKKVVFAEKGLNFNNSFNARHIINAEGINIPIHISISRMGRRIQVFANEEKVLDLTGAFEKDVKLTSARFYVDNSTESDNYYLSNIRYAIGKPDARNKLLDSGTYTTSAITFASGSSEINPESFGILKEIADALKSQGERSVEIIGHTDSDGSRELNQNLSEKRALAVKEALEKDFGVVNEMITNGKGQTEPITDNTTSTGKAKNRRVEFKLINN